MTIKERDVISRLVICCLNSGLALLPLLSGMPSVLRRSQVMADWSFTQLCLVSGCFCGFVWFGGGGFGFVFVRVFRLLGQSCPKT